VKNPARVHRLARSPLAALERLMGELDLQDNVVFTGSVAREVLWVVLCERHNGSLSDSLSKAEAAGPWLRP